MGIHFQMASSTIHGMPNTPNRPHPNLATSLQSIQQELWISALRERHAEIGDDWNPEALSRLPDSVTRPLLSVYVVYDRSPHDMPTPILGAESVSLVRSGPAFDTYPYIRAQSPNATAHQRLVALIDMPAQVLALDLSAGTDTRLCTQATVLTQPDSPAFAAKTTDLYDSGWFDEATHVDIHTVSKIRDTFGEDAAQALDDETCAALAAAALASHPHIDGM